MTKLRTLKNELKKQNVWNDYKTKFKHKQMKLLFSKVVLIFNPEISIEQLIKYEISMLNANLEKGELMFSDAFKDAKQLSNIDADWESFAKFIFYVYQTSTYWKDEKKNIKNVFTHENYIQVNQLKRNHYYKWLHSLNISIPDYNAKIIKTMNEVF